MAKKIITVCGLGASMAPLVASKIKEHLKKSGISGVDVVTAKVPELASVVEGALCIVTTVKIRQDYGIPIIDGSEFIMGGDGQETMEAVMKVIKA
jgi:galactitol PTS system EIIB component